MSDPAPTPDRRVMNERETLRASSPRRRMIRRIGLAVLIVTAGVSSWRDIESHEFRLVERVVVDGWPAELIISGEGSGDWFAAWSEMRCAVALPEAWPDGSSTTRAFSIQRPETDVVALLDGPRLRIRHPDTLQPVDLALEMSDDRREDSALTSLGTYWPGFAPGPRWHARGAATTLVWFVLRVIRMALLPGLLLVLITGDIPWRRRLGRWCWKCDYDLRGTSGPCPECGRERRT